MVMYDRFMDDRLTAEGQRRGQNGPSREDGGQRGNREYRDNQGSSYNNQQNGKRDYRPPQNGAEPANQGRPGFGENQQRRGPTTRSQTAGNRVQNPQQTQGQNLLTGAPRPKYVEREEYLRLSAEEKDRLRNESEKWKAANRQ